MKKIIINSEQQTISLSEAEVNKGIIAINPNGDIVGMICYTTDNHYYLSRIDDLSTSKRSSLEAVMSHHKNLTFYQLY